MEEHNISSGELWHITLAYVNGQEGGEGPTLEELIDTYPQYARELVDYAMEYYLTETLSHAPTILTNIEQDDLSLERRILEEAFALIQERSTLTSLLELGRKLGYDMVGLGKELELGLDLLLKLDQRLLTHLPDLLLERLNRVLAVSIEQLQIFFTQPPANAASDSAFFYSARAPVVGQQQSFPEAVRTSRVMTDEQKENWLTACREELGNSDRPKSENRPSIRRQRKRK